MKKKKRLVLNSFCKRSEHSDPFFFFFNSLTRSLTHSLTHSLKGMFFYLFRDTLYRDYTFCNPKCFGKVEISLKNVRPSFTLITFLTSSSILHLAALIPAFDHFWCSQAFHTQYPVFEKVSSYWAILQNDAIGHSAILTGIEIYAVCNDAVWNFCFLFSKCPSKMIIFNFFRESA